MGILCRLVWQLIDIGTVIAWSGGWTLAIAFVLDKTIGLRVTDEEELEGLDTTHMKNLVIEFRG